MGDPGDLVLSIPKKGTLSETLYIPISPAYNSDRPLLFRQPEGRAKGCWKGILNPNSFVQVLGFRVSGYHTHIIYIGFRGLGFRLGLRRKNGRPNGKYS